MFASIKLEASLVFRKTALSLFLIKNYPNSEKQRHKT